MALFLTDGLIALSRREGRQTCIFHSSRSHGNIDAHSSIRTERTEKHSIQIEMGRMRNAVFWFDLRLAHHNGLKFWQTINNAIILYDSVLADCLVQTVRRNLDDTEVEILCEKKKTELERREVLLIVLLENPAYAKAGRDLVREERISLRLEPVCDQRFDGIPKRNCRTRSRPTSADFSVGESSYELIKEERTDGRLLTEEGKKVTLVSDRSGQIMKDQVNVEAFEFLETLE